MNVNLKKKRVGYHVGKTSDWKKAIVTIDTNPEEKTYLAKGGKTTKISKKYKDSIDEFMGAQSSRVKYRERTRRINKKERKKNGNETF